jgi:hypothetical protein
MAPTPRPAQQGQISSATTPPAQPMVHELAVGNYSLGSPDFAKPGLVQEHKLSAESYLLEPPAFDVPVAEEGFWRRVLRKLGRRPKIPDDRRPDMIANTAAWVRAKQAATCRTIFRDDPAVMDYVRGLADAVDVKVSNYTLRRQIIAAAFEILKRDKN